MPRKIQIKKGDKYGKLTLTWRDEYRKKWNKNVYVRYVECVCECWIKKRVLLNSLRSWKTKSCWCWVYKHRMSWTRIYTIFDHIKQRCTNRNRSDWHLYWWKWIKNLWKTFEDFYKDMWPSYEEHVKKYWEKETTIDRINWNWNYCKENCRWATYKEQGNNLSTNREVVYKWKKYPTMSSLCEEYWIKKTTFNMRIKRYWLTIEEAIELPLQNRKWWFKKIKE